MLDFDLALLYEVETRVLNQSIKRNVEKFPEDFMFRLTESEWQILLSSQIVMMDTLPKNRTQKYLPYAFTEHGVTMLASVLKSKKAIEMNIAIVRAFIAMRYFANSHKDLFEQIKDLRKEMLTRIGEHDTQLSAIYDALENLLEKKSEEKEKVDAWIKREKIGFKNKS